MKKLKSEEYDCIKWAEMQPTGDPNYHIGDVILLSDGHTGIIIEVDSPDSDSGWPSQYTLSQIPGYAELDFDAWYCEGDFEKLIAPSPLRVLPKEKNVFPKKKRTLGSST